MPKNFESALSVDMDCCDTEGSAAEGKGRGIWTRLLTPIVIIPVLFGIVTLVFSAVFIQVWLSDREAARREIVSVSRVFENHKQSLLEEMERFAASNAAYVNVVSKPSYSWIRDRFAVSMALDSSPDHIVLIDGNQVPVFRKSFSLAVTEDRFGQKIAGRVADTLTRISDAYVRSLAPAGNGQLRFSGKLSTVSGTDTVLIGGRPNLVAAYAIVPDPGGIPMEKGPPSVLISVFEIDQHHLKTLLASLSLDNLQLVERIPDGMIGTPLLNNAGEELGFLAWHPMSRASSVIMGSLPVLSLSLGAILLMALFILRQNTRTGQRLAQREKEARAAASHDSMTGFASRAHFYHLAGQLLGASDVQSNGASLIYLDLDNLKEANDVHGHMAGDWLITTQARRIREALGSDALIGRVGGDEFLIVIQGRISGDSLPEPLQSLFDVLVEPVEFEGRIIDASCSAGIARYPDHGREILEVIRSADIALQRCKAEGKRSFRVFDTKMDEARRERRQVRCELATALEDNQFELYYQSIVDAGNCRPAHLEALIRWRHPTRGTISPGVFLPVAQDAGLMPDIGAWVLEQAIMDASNRHDVGVSVNVCTSQLKQDGFAESVADFLMRYGLSPERLILEITENLMLEEDARTQEIFGQLQDLRVGLAIDDFGTGYSSLSYLHKYRFNTMKIDRSFVSRIGISSEDDMLVRSLLGIANVMNMKTVGEGVETAAQRDFLVEAGCEYLQGFLFDKPAPLARTALKRAG